jgi:hypothetical protein
MLLDAVLADSRHGWLGTEQDKRNYFREALERDLLPQWYPHLRFGELIQAAKAVTNDILKRASRVH